jgi:hypothetical protein
LVVVVRGDSVCISPGIRSRTWKRRVELKGIMEVNGLDS